MAFQPYGDRIFNLKSISNDCRASKGQNYVVNKIFDMSDAIPREDIVERPANRAYSLSFTRVEWISK